MASTRLTLTQDRAGHASIVEMIHGPAEVAGSPAKRPSLYQMDDDELRSARDRMVKARNNLRTEHAEIPSEQQYTSADGRALLDDIDYYTRVISDVEYEMKLRLLEL